MKKIIFLMSLIICGILYSCGNKPQPIQSEDNETFDPAAQFDAPDPSVEDLTKDIYTATRDTEYNLQDELKAICKANPDKGKLLREQEAGTLDNDQNWVNYKVQIFEKAVVISVQGKKYTYTLDRLTSVPEEIYAMPSEYLKGIWQPATRVPSDTSYEIRYTSLYNRSPTTEVRNIIEDDLG